MSTWRLMTNALTEEGEDYIASFAMQNVDTQEHVIVTLLQNKKGPCSDLIGALRATAALLVKAANPDSPDVPGTKTEKLN